MNYQRNQKYFKDQNYTGGVVLILIGLLMMCVSVILGFFVIAAGVALIFFMYQSKISDAEYDASVSSMLHNMQSRALNKLGIDEDEVKEIAPISFEGYVYNGATEIKRGKDNYWRTNKYEFVMLFFSEHEVHCYTYSFNTTSESQQQTEATDVYFYQDIVSVSTASDSIRMQNNDISYEYFKLTTTGGTALSVSLKDVNNAQRSINAMRALLKSKKLG